MDLFQTIRNKAFWIKDSINRNAVKNNLEDIQTILENYPSLPSRVRREHLLSALLQHATRSTPYYSNYKTASLSDFPVINKNLIRNDYRAFHSQNYKDEQTIKIMTSGSTGTPFTVSQDKRKKDRNTADTIYFAGRPN